MQKQGSGQHPKVPLSKVPDVLDTSVMARHIQSQLIIKQNHKQTETHCSNPPPVLCVSFRKSGEILPELLKEVARLRKEPLLPALAVPAEDLPAPTSPPSGSGGGPTLSRTASRGSSTPATMRKTRAPSPAPPAQRAPSPGMKSSSKAVPQSNYKNGLRLKKNNMWGVQLNMIQHSSEHL